MATIFENFGKGIPTENEQEGCGFQNYTFYIQVLSP